MKAFWVVALAALIIAGCCGSASGQPPLTITDAGYFITVVGADGVPAMVKITNVTDLRDGTTLPPKPDPEQKPPKPTPPQAGISADASEWASETQDMDGAQRYAMVLEVVRDASMDGKVTQSNVFRVLKAAGELYLDDRWGAFRRKLGDHLTTQQQDGRLTSNVKLANEMERIRYGVGYAARNSKPIPAGETIEVIAQINSLIEEAN